jgi:primosomal protein N' (replication factor Y)
LGSATPSIETYYKAQKGKYGLVHLTERFQNTHLPQLRIVNMQLEQQRHKVQGEFSSHLVQALQDTLAHNEQALIFQNRRGYATYLLCEHCGWVPTCSHCAVSLTYHQYKDRLVCHYCGHHSLVPTYCSSCQTTLLKNKGFGTEKIEETLRRLFPDKGIARMDLETTRRKDTHQKIITDVEKGHTAILVGTQMISKGLDFGKVTLVGVVDIDGLLCFPDFRAHERCFQLVLQVSGRAGRRQKQGQVIIQTKNPSHPLLPYLLTHDYEQMYQRELLDRQKFRYPPYVRLIKITCQHAQENLAMLVAKKLKEKVQAFLSPENILGPQPPMITKVKNLYRIDLWLKLEKMATPLLNETKSRLLQLGQEMIALKPFRTVRIIFDVDPL